MTHDNMSRFFYRPDRLWRKILLLFWRGFMPDMDNHVDCLDFMPRRCIRQLRKDHIIIRNIDKLVIFRFVKMMVVISIRVKKALFIMYHDPPQQPSMGKLVQRVINGTARYMKACRDDLFSQAVSSNMTMPAIQKQGRNCQPLAGWTQSGKAQCFHKISRFRRLGVLARLLFSQFNHSRIKMGGHRLNVNNALAWRGVSCFL